MENNDVICEMSEKQDRFDFETAEIVEDLKRKPKKSVLIGSDEIELFNGFKDGEELNKKYPDTFYLPNKVERSNMPIGSEVKVIAGFERFWVMILRSIILDRKPAYLGMVDNDLLIGIQENCPIDYGAIVLVEPKHIIDTSIDKNTSKKLYKR